MKRDNLIFGMFRFLVIVGLVAVVLLYTKEFAVKAYDYGKRIVNEPPVSDPETEEVKTITVPITEKVSPKSLGNLLKAQGLIRDDTLFVLQYYCSAYRKDLKPGTYELNSGMTAEEMFAVMAGEGEDKK